MGLDNGIIVKSNKRRLKQSDLPKGIKFPFSAELDDMYTAGPEVCYWRKCWGLRGEILDYLCDLHVDADRDEDYNFVINTPDEVFGIIKIILRFMDPYVWKHEAESIWKYGDIKDILKEQVINLSIIASFMESNPDVYCEFYDSY